MSRATRDNTGRRGFEEGTVLPTLDFPSDHAIVSAVLALRPRRPAPVRARAGGGRSKAAAAAAAVIATTRLSAGAVGRRERTLYDYWGIGEKPAAFGSLMLPVASSAAAAAVAAIPTRVAASAVAGPGGAAGHPEAGASEAEATEEEEVRGLVAAHYGRLVHGGRWDRFDGRKEAVARSSDRMVRPPLGGPGGGGG